jgi:hypothetical protein
LLTTCFDSLRAARSASYAASIRDATPSSVTVALIDRHAHVGSGVHLRLREPLLDLALHVGVVGPCDRGAERITLTAASATSAR